MSALDKIDEHLGRYYKKLGRNDYFNASNVGKFKIFAEECAFDDDIVDELAQTYEECTVLEFDMDDDGNNNFPLEESMSGSDERNEEIHRILNDIAKYGAATKPETMELKINICADLSAKELQTFTDKYVSQIHSLGKKGKNSDLKYYLAVGLKQEYPFLMYLVNIFSNAKVEYFHKYKKELTMLKWTKHNNFFTALQQKYPDKAAQLESAMQTYNNRIMCRLQFEPTYKVNDSLKQISEYIGAVPIFITKLIAMKNSTQPITPPFQVDLLIAVKGVVAQFDHDKDGDSDEEDEEKELNPRVDHIGDVEEEFNKMKIYYAANTNNYYDEAEDKRNEKTQMITRRIGTRFSQFRTVLSGEKSDAGKSKLFDEKTYPKGRRFSIFIDRRKSKPKHDDEITIFEPPDEITIFEPPNGCNQITNDRVPEIGFEFVKTCLFPKQKGHITATDSLCGQLMTFMFNVEEKEEIRCYIIWNSQTMRFHGDYVSKILPNLFVDTQENQKFVASKDAKQFEETFEANVTDRKYSMFDQALTNLA